MGGLSLLRRYFLLGVRNWVSAEEVGRRGWLKVTPWYWASLPTPRVALVVLCRMSVGDIWYIRESLECLLPCCHHENLTELYKCFHSATCDIITTIESRAGLGNSLNKISNSSFISTNKLTLGAGKQLDGFWIFCCPQTFIILVCSLEFVTINLRQSLEFIKIRLFFHIQYDSQRWPLTQPVKMLLLIKSASC